MMKYIMRGLQLIKGMKTIWLLMHAFTYAHPRYVTLCKRRSHVVMCFTDGKCVEILLMEFRPMEERKVHFSCGREGRVLAVSILQRNILYRCMNE